MIFGAIVIFIVIFIFIAIVIVVVIVVAIVVAILISTPILTDIAINSIPWSTCTTKRPAISTVNYEPPHDTLDKTMTITIPLEAFRFILNI